MALLWLGSSVWAECHIDLLIVTLFIVTLILHQITDIHAPDSFLTRKSELLSEAMRAFEVIVFES